MLKFSLLVPVYNGERYLNKLLDSLLSQDMHSEEYEIVLIDDCSKDHSVEILEKYQKDYANIRLLRNTKNSKAGTNVNKLATFANGEYLWFIGQDDYIAHNCLNRLYDTLKQEDLDVLVFNYRRVFEDEQIQSECKVVSSINKMNGIDWVKYEFADRDYCQYLLGYEWRAVYRKAFWKEKNIRCVDGMNYEDTIIMMKAIVMSNAVASISDVLYNYRINSASITYRKDFVKRGDLIYEFAFKVGQEVEDFYRELEKIDEPISESLYRHLVQRYNNFTFDLIRTPNEYKHEFYRLVSENRQYVNSKRHYLNWKSRILTHYYVGYPIACSLYYMYKAYKYLKYN